jgi:hypothetical protein
VTEVAARRVKRIRRLIVLGLGNIPMDLFMGMLLVRCSAVARAPMIAPCMQKKKEDGDIMRIMRRIRSL